jgi:glycosyltransferase involved in cell wall biosynthesis
MKITIIAPALPSNGGAARFTWEFSEYLASQNDDVTIISLYSNKDLFKGKNNLRIIDLADQNSMTQSIKFWINLSKTRKKIKCLIDELKPDIVLFMNFPATLWAQKFGKIPVLCYPQDINLLYTNTYIKNLSPLKYFFWYFFRILIRIIDKKRWESFDEVICNSEYSEKSITSKYNVPTRVIHLGTRTKFFKPQGKKKNVILCIAAQKAQRADFLIESISNLLKTRKDFEIWIVGNRGIHEAELKSLVDSHNISKWVKFFGIVTDKQLVELYSEALVTVHLVRQPPFGMIVTESMACGTPVIGCFPGGIEETIQHNETGFLIKEEDAKQLEEYISKILNEPKLSISMGNKGRERVKKKFEMSKKNLEFRNLILNWIDKKLK